MKTLSRRQALANLGSAVALPASATALAACGAGGTGDAARPVAIRPDVMLQLIIDLQAQFQPQFENVLTRWRQSIPGGAPKVEYTIGAVAVVLEKTQAQLAAGNPPDLFQQEVTGAIGLIAKNQVLPLDAYIKRDKYDLSEIGRAHV